MNCLPPFWKWVDTAPQWSAWGTSEPGIGWLRAVERWEAHRALTSPQDAHQLFCSLCFFLGHKGLLRLSILPGASQNPVISSRGEKRRKKAVVAFGRPGRRNGSGASYWRCFGARITRWTSSCSGSLTAGTSTSFRRPCSVSTFERHLPERLPPCQLQPHPAQPLRGSLCCSDPDRDPL